MPKYYVNKNEQSNGDHEVHKESCEYLPEEKNRISLGEFENCKEAIRRARMFYEQVNGYVYCSKEWHTK